MMNRVLTDKDRTELSSVMERMRLYWPEMYARKIPDSMVQFAFCYQTALSFASKMKPGQRLVLSAGSHEDIATECLKLDGLSVVGIDPVINCDLHTFALRANKQFHIVISASVLEHTTDDEEFVKDCCDLLLPGGYGVFTMDFKNDWMPGQKVPYTSNRFYTAQDLTSRLLKVLQANGCDLIDVPNYSAQDRFVWDGINYSFATWVFKKEI